MRYFYDSEFIEDGVTIELVSIGIVAEDGREYYAVSTGFDASRANQWVKDNVLNKLPSPGDAAWKSPATIRDEVVEFFGSDKVELWAWVGAYDHIVLAQLFGDMSAMPHKLPRFTNELKQYWNLAGRPSLPPVPPGNHDALVDARHNLAKFKAIYEVLPIDASGRIQR